MIFALLIALPLAAILAYVAWSSLTAYIASMRNRNGLLALAVHEMSEVSAAILKTPEEIPDRVLDMLEFMNKTAFEKDTPRAFSEVAADKAGTAPTAGANALAADIEGMRPELRDLFMKLTASWLNIVCNRNLKYGMRIAMAFNGIKVRRKEVKIDEERVTLELLKRLGGPESKVMAAAIPRC